MITFDLNQYMPAVFAGYFFLFLLVLLVWNKIRRKIFLFGPKSVLKTLGKPSGSLRILFRLFLLSLIPLGFSLILLGPTKSKSYQEPIYKNAEIVFFQDISRSALIKDVEKENGVNLSRLDFVKDELIKTIKGLTRDRAENKIGLVLYAGSAVPLTPILSNDYEQTLLPIFEELDCHYLVSAIPQGTDLGLALKTGLPLFSSEAGPKTLVIIGDGENQGETDSLEINMKEGMAVYQKFKKEIERKGERLKVLVIGVGNPDKFSPIPDELNQNCSPRSFLKNSREETVFSRPNHRFLKTMAETLAGEFKTARRQGDIIKEISGIFSDKNRPVKWYEQKTEVKDVSDWFFAGILAVLVLFLIL